MKYKNPALSVNWLEFSWKLIDRSCLVIFLVVHLSPDLIPVLEHWKQEEQNL